MLKQKYLKNHFIQSVRMLKLKEKYFIISFSIQRSFDAQANYITGVRNDGYRLATKLFITYLKALILLF